MRTYRINESSCDAFIEGEGKRFEGFMLAQHPEVEIDYRSGDCETMESGWSDGSPDNYWDEYCNASLDAHLR